VWCGENTDSRFGTIVLRNTSHDAGGTDATVSIWIIYTPSVNTSITWTRTAQDMQAEGEEAAPLCQPLPLPTWRWPRSMRCSAPMIVVPRRVAMRRSREMVGATNWRRAA
jgi:hypothetical protein